MNLANSKCLTIAILWLSAFCAAGQSHAQSKPTITTTAIPNPVIQQPYFAKINVTGGTPPYNFSTYSTGFPLELSIGPDPNDPNTGIISGTPIQSGQFFIQITVLDSNNVFSDTVVYAVTVGLNPPPSGCVVTPAAQIVANGTNITLSASCAFPSTGVTFTWTRNPAGPAFPPGATLQDTATNVTAQPITYTYQATACLTGTTSCASPVTATVTVQPGQAAPTGCTATATPSSLSNQGGLVTLNASGCQNVGPNTVYTWTKGGNLFKVGPSVTDTLPPNTGLQPVPYTYQLQVCNPVNQCQQAAASVTVTVAGAFTFSPPSGATFSATAQTQFNQTITATSSAPGVAFTSVAGLPVGLTATPSGGVLTISGTPATPGSSTIDVAVTDSQGSIGRATYTLVVVGLASNIVIVSGNQQTVPALTAVAPLTVLVTNNGVPAPGVTVSWSQTGGGTLGSATTVTGSNGQTSNSYITGPQDIENTVTARVGASTAVFTIKNTTVSIVKPAQTLIGPLAAAAIAAPTIQLNNIRLRLDQLRLQTSPTLAEALKVSVDGRSLPPSSAFALAPLDKDGNTVRGGGAAADNPGPSDRWSVFINGDIDIGKQSTMGTQTGFKVRSKGVTIGADYRFVGNHALGASVGFVNSDTDLDANAGTQNTEGYSFSLYGTYVPAPNAYLYGSLNVGHNSYDGTRRGEAGSTFNNSTSGNQWAIEIGGGYAFNRSPVAMTPYGRLQYVDAKINGFTENGDPEATLTISEQRIKSTLLGVGGTISYAIETSWGHVIPNGRLEYLYLANLNTQSATAQIAGSAQTQIEVSRPDKNYGLFAVGISWIHRGLNAFFNYQQQFGKQNFTDQMYTLGVKYEF